MLQRTSWGRGTAVTVVSCVFQHTNLPKSGALQSTPTMFMAQLCLYCCQSICKCPIRVDGFFCGWRDPSLSPRWSSFAPGCFALTCGKHLTYSDFICASWQTKCFKTIHLGFYVFCLVFGFWFFFFGKSIGRIGFFFFFSWHSFSLEQEGEVNASIDGREGGTEAQSATEVAQRTEQDREVVSHGCSAFWLRSSHSFLPKT